jgi:hypothetical protein
LEELRVLPAKSVMTAGANILSAGFRIDGGAMIPASASGTDEFSALLNTTLYADGFHNIDSLATNAAGSTFETAHVYFDNTPPLLSVETPTANQTIFLVKNIVVRASDASGLPLASVRINLNGSSLAFFPGHADVANQIYSYTLDTTGAAAAERSDTSNTTRTAPPSPREVAPTAKRWEPLTSRPVNSS